MQFYKHMHHDEERIWREHGWSCAVRCADIAIVQMTLAKLKMSCHGYWLGIDIFIRKSLRNSTCTSVWYGNFYLMFLFENSRIVINKSIYCWLYRYCLGEAPNTRENIDIDIDTWDMDVSFFKCNVT